MINVNVSNKTRSLEKPLRVKNCDTFFCRLRGLMFQNDLDMDLGIIWLNKDRKIVDIQLAESWKPIYTPQHPAQYILEINPLRMPEFNIGDELDFE